VPYLVQVSVADAGNYSAATSFHAAIAYVAPTLYVDGASSSDQGDTYVLSLDAAVYGNAGIGTWTVNWGDNTSDTVDPSAGYAEHEYDTPGSYSITAGTSDGITSLNTNASPTAVTVSEVQPVLQVDGPPTLNEGDEAQITLTSACVGDNYVSRCTYRRTLW
jgi:hypothetical protein